ncbi:MAG: DUF1003 domain-containing protein [Acidimicrobiales bacterium]
MRLRDEAVSRPGRVGATSLTPSYDADSIGRASESVARYLGTGRYLFIQTIVVIAWIALNVAAVSLRWDPYPFILLNLLFSTQAAYAAPLILLAQSRQDARDRAIAERDREVSARILSDTEFLSRELAAIRLRLEAVATTDDLESLQEDVAELLSTHRVDERADGQPSSPGKRESGV